LNNHPGASRHPSCPGGAIEATRQFALRFWSVQSVGTLATIAVLEI